MSQDSRISFVVKTPEVTFEWLKIPDMLVVDFTNEKCWQWFIMKRSGY